ncbi:ATP-grasp domain-containing protein [Pedobacter sp.]|uniref:ATP-grasp domain-containing protein n=1 Tax=Pedobacter sp. TaxID=1411316 RepID=UPI003BAA23F7
MKKNILVTAVGGRSVGSGVLHALTRCSPEVKNRWNVIGADAESFAWGLYKTPSSTLLPLANSADYIDSVIKAVHQFKIDAIIPGSEAEASVLSQNKDKFDAPIIANSFNLMPLMMDKFATTNKLVELGLPTIPMRKIEDWESAVSEFGFPLIVKPTTGTGGSKGVSLCTTLVELKTIIQNLPVNSGYCVQPLIGSDDEEYTVGILSDKNGNLVDSIVMKRKLIGLSLLDTKIVNDQKLSISTGYSQGFFIKHKQVQEFCEKLSANLESKGPLNIQLRIHKGEIYVFEIHPRFSGTTTMRADVGFNEPDILLRNYLFGETFSRLDYQYNVAAIRAFEHVIVPIDQML